MFAILAEDGSDKEVLTHIVRRFFGNEGLTIKGKGYDGCGALIRKGARDIKAWAAMGIDRFIICHDADANAPQEIRRKIEASVVTAANFKGVHCIAIPVEEIEAWLIADEVAINQVIPSFRFAGHPHPEQISNPKEWLISQSRKANGKPLYSPATFNAAVAKHLRHDVVAIKCPSFKAFLDCLRKADRQ